jgi:hypothetical protein
MPKPVALAVLSSDALVHAYGLEAMSAVLALASSGALGLLVSDRLRDRRGHDRGWVLLPSAHRGYANGGGSYAAAHVNLGELPALIAAITSALPGLAGDTVPLGLAIIALLVAGNLRGVRQAGVMFSAPTYTFVRRCLH